MDDTTAPLPLRLAGKRKLQSLAASPVADGTALFGAEDSARRVDAAVAGLALVAWYEANRQELERLLAQQGALLLRGFSLSDSSQFGAVVRSLGQALSYTYRSTPRTEVAADIYSSTEYPASESIPLHNENSYASSWPMRIAFHCVQPSPQGGATPIADSRRVHDALDPALRRRFAERGVMYVRNFGGGVDLSWQNAFQSEDRGAVEAFCRSAGIAWEWKDGGGLRTRQVCPAIRLHPQRGEAVWFNQAHLFHVSALAPAMRDSLLAAFALADLPRNACYGDGSEIEASVLDEIRGVYRQYTLAFDWRQDDVLLLDNMLYAHGREPYAGPRRIHVGMAVACSGATV